MYYRLIGDSENYRNYIMVGYSQEYADTFDGRNHAKTYQPQTFKLTKKSEKKYPIADIATGYLPICSEKAKKVIEEFCSEKEVEFLPCYLDATNENFYILNILGQEDCVDYDKSEFKTFPSSNKIMYFNHIGFKEQVNRHFFRIKDLPYCHYFISQEAKEKLEKAGLKGLVFDNKMFIKGQ